MSALFGALSTLFRKMETFSNYFIERVSASYESFGQAQKVGLSIFIILVVLFLWYILVLILRFSFKRRTRKLKNVRREYQITLNRAKGKRCNFIWDILLFQKMVILDDPVMPKEILDEKQVFLPFQDEQRRVAATPQEQPVPEETKVEEVIVVEPKQEPVVEEKPYVEEVIKEEPVVEEVVESEPDVVEVVKQPEPEPVKEEPRPEPVKEEPKPEPVKEEPKPEPVKEEPKPEPKKEEVKVKEPAVKKKKVADVKRTKRDLIEYMVENTDINKSKANRFLKYFAEVITDALKESDSIKLDEFGTFLVLDIEESTRYIPSKDEMRVLPAHKEVRYRAARELKDLLNKED